MPATRQIRDDSYIGKGTIYMGKYPDGPLMPIGNCSALNFAVDQTSITLQNYMTAGGGNRNEVQRVNAVTANITAHDINSQMLDMVLRGSSTQPAITPVTDEPHSASPGALVDLIKIPEPGSISVKIGEDPATEGEDYEITNAGIRWLSDEDDILVSYTPADQTLTEALTNAGEEYRLVFDGLNEAQSGRPVKIRVHRLKPSTSPVDWIGDEFAELQIEASVLSDPAITGLGLSPYYQVLLAR